MLDVSFPICLQRLLAMVFVATIKASTDSHSGMCEFTRSHTAYTGSGPGETWSAEHGWVPKLPKTNGKLGAIVGHLQPVCCTRWCNIWCLENDDANESWTMKCFSQLLHCLLFAVLSTLLLNGVTKSFRATAQNRCAICTKSSTGATFHLLSVSPWSYAIFCTSSSDTPFAEQPLTLSSFCVRCFGFAQTSVSICINRKTDIYENIYLQIQMYTSAL